MSTNLTLQKRTKYVQDRVIFIKYKIIDFV